MTTMLDAGVFRKLVCRFRLFNTTLPLFAAARHSQLFPPAKCRSEPTAAICSLPRKSGMLSCPFVPVQFLERRDSASTDPMLVVSTAHLIGRLVQSR